MRKLTLAVAALTFILGPSISRAADPITGAGGQPQAGSAPSNPDAMGANQAGTNQAGSIQTPPADWTSLNGTVQSVDASNKTVQIQDTTGNLVQVNVDKQVSIQKDGKKVKLSQVQTGDSITLARNTAMDQNKPKTY
jgi:hypothetical protein